MIKKVLKTGGAVLGGLITLVTVFALYVEIHGIPRYEKPKTDDRVVVITPQKVEQGAKLASLLCSGCHEDQETHRYTGKHLDDVPPLFGVIYSKNITQHPTQGVGGWTDGELRYFLRTGVRPDGQYVPPYMIKLPQMSDADLDSIIAFLRSEDPRVASSDADPGGVTQPSFVVKALSHVMFKPLPYPQGEVVAPPKSDAVAYGRYLVASRDCYGCHSEDFTTMNVLEPEKTPGFMGGGNRFVVGDTTIDSANLTADPETGIGRWTEEDFRRALRKGIRPDGRPLRAPMGAKPEIDDAEADAIYAYLRSIPIIRNNVTRPSAPGTPSANASSTDATSASSLGKAAYERYGCNSCHGETGLGNLGDLRTANTNYPTDAELRRWIDEAPKLKPNTKMPGWKGMISEEDYPPLLAYVRTLSAANKGKSAPDTPQITGSLEKR